MVARRSARGCPRRCVPFGLRGAAGDHAGAHGIRIRGTICAGELASLALLRTTARFLLGCVRNHVRLALKRLALAPKKSAPRRRAPGTTDSLNVSMGGTYGFDPGRLLFSRGSSSRVQKGGLRMPPTRGRLPRAPARDRRDSCYIISYGIILSLYY